jgi:diguanylate cyclase (GGDEF)-like protein
MQLPGMSNHLNAEFEHQALRGFARSMAELQWLLLVLVLLYYFVPTGEVNNSDIVVGIMVSYAIFILLFNYLGLQVFQTRFRLAVETWVMIAFITGVIWHSGMIESPLMNLYLLVIIACAITLGRSMTVLEVVLIAHLYLYMGYKTYSVEILSPQTFTALMAGFSPYLLVAYVTSLLAEDIKRARHRIMLLSQTDELTGLLNLRAFKLLWKRQLHSVRMAVRPFAILMVDLDGLKQINDHFGHAAGNKLIEQVAKTIKACVRETDVVARYGGDEFVIMLPNVDVPQAESCAERIRNRITEAGFDVDGHRVSSTASVGIACFPYQVQQPESVMDKADAALYRSKQQGRNRVTRYRPDTATTAQPA